MSQVVRFFAEGGSGMYLLLLLGLALVTVAIVSCVSRDEKLRVATMIGFGVVILAGAALTVHGRSITDAAIVSVSPDVRERIREQGYAESNRPIELAGVLCVCGLVPFLIGEARRRGPS